MRYLLKPLQWIYCLYAVATFLGIMLLIFPFVMFASFFGRVRGGNMIYRLCTLWSDLWLPLVFIFCKRIYESPYDKSRQYIFVANHESFLDPAILVNVIRQPLRPLAKSELKKVPLFGYIYKRAVVSVDRSSTINRAKSMRSMSSIINKGISILVFPEGTFNMTHEPLKEFYDGAFRLAIETQTSIKPVLFLDTYDRLRYAHFFSLTPGKCRVVYLDEIPVNGLTWADVFSLKQKVFDVMQEKLIEYKASWIMK